jgi:hypothetical protein
MKHLSILVIILLSTFTSFSQKDKDTTRVEQYCQVVATPRLLSNRVTIDIDYGEERSIWRDNRVKADDGRLKKFNTTIDALNYMGKDGWTLVNAFPVFTANTQVYHYVFKKVFRRSDVAE